MFVLYIMELYLYKYMCKVELEPVDFEVERFMQSFTRTDFIKGLYLTLRIMLGLFKYICQQITELLTCKWSRVVIVGHNVGHNATRLFLSFV